MNDKLHTECGQALKDRNIRIIRNIRNIRKNRIIRGSEGLIAAMNDKPHKEYQQARNGA